MVKPVLYGESEQKAPVQECLLYVLDNTLRLLHPIMPYVTEEIWQNIPGNQVNSSIMIAAYPESLTRDEAAEAEMEVIMETVMGIRTIRGELNLSPSLELRAMVRTQTSQAEEMISRNLACIRKLARADIVEIGGGVVKPRGSAAAIRTFAEVYVPLEGLLDLKAEIERLRKENEKLDETIVFLNKKLLNEDFLKRAPKDIVLKEREKYDECVRKKERVQDNIRKLHEAGGNENGES
jgi:valyl-tRNA synthetase